MLSSGTNEIFTVKFRYKKPSEQKSELIIHPVSDDHVALNNTSDNFRFAASVAEFGMLLCNSNFKSQASISQVLKLAEQAKGHDSEGYRHEFLELVKKSGAIKKADDVAGNE